MYYKSILLFFVFISSLFAQNINIAVAANVSYAIVEVQKEFNKLHPNTKVKIILGSSGKLTAQINHGAPYDVFMSANMMYPESLFLNKNAVSKPLVYAKGSLSFLSRSPRDFSRGIEVLFDKDISRIAVANPKTAPYGKASFEALKNAKVLDKVQSKIVYGESASQTLSYTLKATDIGLVASSALYSPKLKRFKKGVHWQEVQATLYVPIEQGIVLLKHGEKNKQAQAFYNFILSEKAKTIFASYGYTTL